MIRSTPATLPALPGANTLRTGAKTGEPAVPSSSVTTPGDAAPLDFSQVLGSSATTQPVSLLPSSGKALQADTAEPALPLSPAPKPVTTQAIAAEPSLPLQSPVATPGGKSGKILPEREKVMTGATQEAPANKSAETSAHKHFGKTASKVSQDTPDDMRASTPHTAPREIITPVAEPSRPENPQPILPTGTPPESPVALPDLPSTSTGTAEALALLQAPNTRAPVASATAHAAPSTASPTRMATPAQSPSSPVAPAPAMPVAGDASGAGPVALPLQLPSVPLEGNRPATSTRTGVPPFSTPDIRPAALVAAPVTATAEILRASTRTAPDPPLPAVPQTPAHTPPTDAPASQRATVAQPLSAPLPTAAQDAPSAPTPPDRREPAIDFTAPTPLANAPASAIAAPAAPAITAPAVQAPQDFATLVQRLAEAREAVTPQVVQAALVHAEFGRVNLALRHEDGGLSVTMASLDPTFAPAVQAALAAGGEAGRERIQGEPQQQAPSRHGSDPRSESSQSRQDGSSTSGNSSAPTNGSQPGGTATSNSGQQQRETARGTAATDTRPARNGSSGSGFPGSDTSPSSPSRGPQASGLYA